MGGINKFLAFHKTCWVLSPGMPQLTVFGDLKYFFQIFWYRVSPATMESPVSKVVGCIRLVRQICFWWFSNQPTLLRHVDGILAHSTVICLRFIM